MESDPEGGRAAAPAPARPAAPVRELPRERRPNALRGPGHLGPFVEQGHRALRPLEHGDPAAGVGQRVQIEEEGLDAGGFQLFNNEFEVFFVLFAVCLLWMFRILAVFSGGRINVFYIVQTKIKILSTAKACLWDKTIKRIDFELLINEKLSLYLSDLKNSEVVNKFLEKALQSAKVRAATQKATKLARKRSALEGAPLVGKLSSCTGRKPSENELILVEGDSAGGSAKQARDRRFQAILPLRGKPLNAERKRLDAVLGNEEFRSIITALGAGIDADFDIDKLKYHKIIILSDADQDGAHIRAILLTFFFRYMKELVTNGNIFIGQPPLYKVKRGRSEVYCYDDKALKIAIEEIGKGYSIQRYKGLGEMNPEQLWDTTLNPDGRKLVQVSIEDAAEADRLVSLLMGDKVEPRRDYIISHANFDGGDIVKGVEGAANG